MEKIPDNPIVKTESQIRRNQGRCHQSTAHKPPVNQPEDQSSAILHERLENIWQYLRQTWLSNRVFETYDAILDAGCDAWNRLTAQPKTIMSIGMCDWESL